MAGNRFSFITDDMLLQHNVATPLNYHKVDSAGSAGKICGNARLREDFRSKFEERFTVVREYFEYRRSMVEIIDLRDIVPGLSNILLNLQSP